MELGEVDLGLGPDLLPTIIQAIMVDHMVYIFRVIEEMEIDIKPVKFLHITMVN